MRWGIGEDYRPATLSKPVGLRVSLWIVTLPPFLTNPTSG